VDLQILEKTVTCAPVLFLIFNRPELTKRVFARIRKARPAKLFVAADGPRFDKPEDREKCRITRSLINVDWDCDLYTLYREINLGIGLGPSTAISWFFENVEQGIILEDDCLPNDSFFYFCSQLLDYYNNYKNILSICGTNILEEFDSTYSYVYSYYGGIWGWATWRRAWELYDYEMKLWNDFEIKIKISNLLSDKRQYDGVKRIFDNMPETWDIQWFFTRLAYGGLSIVPVKNLISNIGFGKEATHTLNEDRNFSRLSVYDLEFPLKIDPDIKVNRSFDYLNAEKYGYYKNNSAIIKIMEKGYDLLKRLYG
jgi:hypothetical protein